MYQVSTTSESSRGRRYIFFQAGRLYVSFNGYSLPAAPPPHLTATSPLNLMHPGYCRRTLWHNHQHPFLHFSVAFPTPTDRFFKRFAKSDGEFIIRPEMNEDGTKTLWRLDEYARGKWYNLEGTLRAGLKYLKRKVHIPLNDKAQSFRNPSQYGYLDAHDTKEATLKRAIESRDAFIPLMAEFCMYFWAFEELSGTDRDGNIVWEHLFLTELRWPLAFLTDLCKTQFLDKKDYRMGTVVFMSENVDDLAPDFEPLFLAIQSGIQVAFQFKLDHVYPIPPKYAKWSLAWPTADDITWATESARRIAAEHPVDPAAAKIYDMTAWVKCELEPSVPTTARVVVRGQNGAAAPNRRPTASTAAHFPAARSAVVEYDIPMESDFPVEDHHHPAESDSTVARRPISEFVH